MTMIPHNFAEPAYSSMRRLTKPGACDNHAPWPDGHGGEMEKQEAGATEQKNEIPGLGRAGFKAHCPHCRHETLFVRARLSNRRHLLLTIVTAGLWAIAWCTLFIGKCLRPWRCSLCGWHKPEFHRTSRIGLV